MLSTQPPHPNPSFSFDQANYSSIYRIQRIDTHSTINQNWQINDILNPIVSLMVTPSSPDLSLLDHLKSICLPSKLITSTTHIPRLVNCTIDTRFIVNNFIQFDHSLHLTNLIQAPSTTIHNPHTFAFSRSPSHPSHLSLLFQITFINYMTKLGLTTTHSSLPPIILDTSSTIN